MSSRSPNQGDAAALLLATHGGGHAALLLLPASTARAHALVRAASRWAPCRAPRLPPLPEPQITMFRGVAAIARAPLTGPAERGEAGADACSPEPGVAAGALVRRWSNRYEGAVAMRWRVSDAERGRVLLPRRKLSVQGDFTVAGGVWMQIVNIALVSLSILLVQSSANAETASQFRCTFCTLIFTVDYAPPLGVGIITIQHKSHFCHAVCSVTRHD